MQSGIFSFMQTPQNSVQSDPNAIPTVAVSENSVLKQLSDDGGKKKKYDSGEEMRQLYKRPLKYDSNKPAVEVVRSAAARAGINPALLFSSSFQEGLNKAIADPDNVSEAYNMALKKDKELSGYPVDGFYNYGTDTFGTRIKELSKYLPKDFEGRYRLFDAVNERGEKVKTAAFKTNEDALVAKSAFIRAEADAISEYAKSKGIPLDEDALNYFTLAAYNSGSGNARKMLEKFAAAKDKKAFLEAGDASWQKVHKNISPRMKNMAIAAELLAEK